MSPPSTLSATSTPALSATLVTEAQLRQLCPQATLDLKALASAMNDSFPTYNINKPLRIAHFLGQAAIETAYLTTMEEDGSDSYFLRYEPGTSSGDAVGNTKVGDGKLFKGRGLLQMTGRWNYEYFATNGHPGMAENPKLLLGIRFGTEVSAHYWEWKGCNASADADSVSAVTYKVQGGQDAIDRRRTYTKRAKVIWGVSNDLTGSVGKGGANADIDVIRVQQRLAAKGYDPGSADGNMNDQTLAAILAFQHTLTSTPDGRIDPGGKSWTELSH